MEIKSRFTPLLTYKSLSILVLLVSVLFTTYAKDKYATPKSYCFLIYDINEKKLLRAYETPFCQKRISADSTFKIAISLIAYDKGLINSSTIIKWDGKKRQFDNWNHDQTPKSWLQYSALWVSQVLTPKLGEKTILRYLKDFDYGNQDFSGDPGKHNGLTHAWVSSSLKISALEQLAFLNHIIEHKLTISKEAINETINNIKLNQDIDGFQLYGKTGSGCEESTCHTLNGWFVGYLIKYNKKYSFVVNFNDNKSHYPKNTWGGEISKHIFYKKISKLDLNHP